MLRKFVCAAVIVVFGLSVVLAEEFNANISKVDGSKITFTKVKKGEKGEVTSMSVPPTAKITKGKFNADTKKLEAGDPIADGLKNEMFTKISDKGLNVRITTDDATKNITAITVGGGKKKAAN